MQIDVHDDTEDTGIRITRPDGTADIAFDDGSILEQTEPPSNRDATHDAELLLQTSGLRMSGLKEASSVVFPFENNN